MTSARWSNPELAALFSRGGDAPAAEAAPEEVTWERRAYRESAAVLASFSPATLRPFGGEREPGGAVAELLEDSVQTFGRTGDDIRWTLKSDVRREALSALAERGELVAALEANEDRPDTPVQRILEQCLRGETLLLEGRPMSDLTAVSQVADWVAGILPNVPDGAAIQAAIDRKTVIEPLECLLKDGFAGRVSELDRLRNHVELLSAQSAGGQVRRAARSLLGLGETVLVLWGCGGIGKSTLIAKFIVEHVRAARFPYAYLDFDSSKIAASRFATLLIQLLTQIGIEYPERQTAIARFRRHFERQLKAKEPTPAPGGNAAAGLLSNFEIVCIRQLARIMEPLLISDASPPGVLPFLVVLDTFENLHEFSEARTRKLGAFAQALAMRLPSLRVVISGRNDVTKLLATGQEPVEALELPDLDTAAADAILTAWGVADEKERAGILAVAGGNPLALRLAAQLNASGKLDTSMSARVAALARRAMGEGYIQGYFYDRILNHIKDDAVRQLAHPGLALRYLTPEIVLEVLAEPCKLSLKTLDEAKGLLDRLQKYAQLVYPEGEGLRHRSDVRRAMLTALDQDHPGLVREINERAVKYHSGRTDLRSRGEELYHRLRLNQQEWEIEPRWIQGVEEALKGCGTELPIRAQLYLISKRVQADIEGRSRALQQIEIEMLNSEKAQDCLAHGLIDEAKKLIETSPRSPVSPLALPMAQMEALNGNWEAAQPLLDEAQRAAVATGQRADLEISLLLGADTAFQLGNHELSWTLARRAEEVLTKSSRPDRLLWALLFQVRSAEGAHASSEEQAEAVRRLKSQILAASPEKIVSRQLLSFAADAWPGLAAAAGVVTGGFTLSMLLMAAGKAWEWNAKRRDERARMGAAMERLEKVLRESGRKIPAEAAARRVWDAVADPKVAGAVAKVLAHSAEPPVFGVQDVHLDVR